MKKLMFLVFTLCSSMAIACGDNEIQSVGGSISDRNEIRQSDERNSSGEVGTNCIELPLIKAVITYIHISAGWIVSGPRYALSYPGGGGGGTNQIVDVDLWDLVGCDVNTSPEAQNQRNLDASATFQMQRNIRQGIVNNPNVSQYARDRAQLWIDQHSQPGFHYSYEWPNGSTSYFEVVNFNTGTLSESLCVPTDTPW